jgi:NitT/TauT family transport system permease protein
MTALEGTLGSDLGSGVTRRHRHRTREIARRLASPMVIAPLLLGATLLIVWQAGFIHSLFNVKSFTVPYPSSIGTALAKSGTQVTQAIMVTLPAALVGYLLGLGIGALISTLLVRFARRLVNNMLPLLSASNAVPIVALAPVLALWIDDLIVLKVIVVTVMVVPTIVIYLVRGLLSVEPNALELMESIDASPNQVYWIVRTPTALPYLMTALKSCVVLALIGTIVTETLRGFEGLGFVIADSLARFDAPKAWLALLVIAAIGICWYLVVEVLERVALPWESANRQRT